MRMSLRRSTLRATAVLVLGTVLASGAALTAGVVAAPVAGATSAAPPWEPVANPPQAGGLLFFNAAGQQITGGSVSTSPLAAYVEGTAVLNASDDKATLEAYTPVDGVNPGTWSGQGLSSSTVYPNTSAPPPLNTSTLPVVTGSATDVSLATYVLSFPNDDTSSDGYAGLYVLRLISSHPTTTTSYDSADIQITGTGPTATWSVVYPVPTLTSTTTTLTTTPASPQKVGTTVTLNASVSPSAPGTVQFKVGSTDIGSPVTVTNGTASTSDDGPPAGLGRLERRVHPGPVRCLQRFDGHGELHRDGQRARCPDHWHGDRRQRLGLGDLYRPGHQRRQPDHRLHGDQRRRAA